MFHIQLLFSGRWHTIERHPSRDAAEWAVSVWRQENNCRRDPFRVVELHDRPACVGSRRLGLVEARR